MHLTPSLNTGIVVLRASTAANATLRALLEASATGCSAADLISATWDVDDSGWDAQPDAQPSALRLSCKTSGHKLVASA